MRKPKPRAEFASEADEAERMLDSLCWLYAEDMSLDLDIPQEVCADEIKQCILDGRLVLDFNEKRDAVRIIVGPNFTAHSQ
jgi:hypothetical protein